MSGHNKWSKIKHKKGAADAKKSKEFSKLVRLIFIESKQSGGDTVFPGLKMAIDKAKQANMPKEVIKRAVAKGMGGDQETMDHVVYEVYGPGGVAMILRGVTDNRNRTGAEIRHLLSSYNLELATPGSALWAFKKEAEEYVPKTTIALQSGDKEKLTSLVRILQEHNDIEEVYSNEK